MQAGRILAGSTIGAQFIALTQTWYASELIKVWPGVISIKMNIEQVHTYPKRKSEIGVFIQDSQSIDKRWTFSLLSQIIKQF